MSARKKKDPDHHLYQRGPWWWCEYAVDGERTRVALQTIDVEVARSKRDRLLEIAAFERAGVPAPVVHTWQSTVEAWLPHLETSPRRDGTITRYKVSAVQWGLALGDDCPLEDITSETVLDFISERKETGRSASTIRNDLTALSVILKFAKSRKWVATNVVDEVDRHENVGTTDDTLNPPHDEEIGADLVEVGAWRPDMALLLRWLRETGMRLAEALLLRRSDIHPCGKIATLRRGTKGGKVRTIALGRAADLLPLLRKDGRLFGDLSADSAVVSCRYGQWRRQRQGRVNREAAAAGRKPVLLRRWRQHDLRHAFAIASIIDDDTCIYRLQKHLGHSSVSTTEVYVRFLDGEGAQRQYARRTDLFGSLSDGVPMGTTTKTTTSTKQTTSV